MRVPFIAAWARRASSEHQKKLQIPAGKIQTEIANVTDLSPTILELTGLEAPDSHVTDGSSLSSLLRSENDRNRRQEFLMHYPHSPHRSKYFTVYRDGDWKVVYHYFPSEESAGSHYQLFHLKQDPFEQQNLADAKPDELKRMMQGLIASLRTHNAKFPVKDGVPVTPQLP